MSLNIAEYSCWDSGNVGLEISVGRAGDPAVAENQWTELRVGALVLGE